MLGFDHVVRRAGRATLPSGAVPSQLVFLAGIAIFTHPILDTLNTYGVRWLMPFSGRWFYGDTLFIVDPWLWLMLGLGFVWSGRPRGRRTSRLNTGPARTALLLSAGYIAVMALSGVLARRITTGELTALTGERVDALMVGPVLVTPFVREVVATQRSGYRKGTFHWLRRPHIDPASIERYPRARPDGAAVSAAVTTPLGKRFLSWARFPVFQVDAAPGGGALVQIFDLRYADHPTTGFGSVTIPVQALPATPAPPR